MCYPVPEFLRREEFNVDKVDKVDKYVITPMSFDNQNVVDEFIWVLFFGFEVSTHQA